MTLWSVTLNVFNLSVCLDGLLRKGKNDLTLKGILSRLIGNKSHCIQDESIKHYFYKGGKKHLSNILFSSLEELAKIGSFYAFV